MTPEQLDQYRKEGFNRIPIVRKVLTDMDTGLGLYHKIAQGAYSFLFESVHGGERWGRYSIIGLPSYERVIVQGHHVTAIQGTSQTKQTVADPIAYLNDYYQQFKVPNLADLPRFSGGLVGYVGYDSVGFFEEKLQHQLSKSDPLALPDIVLMLCEELVVLDNVSGIVSIIVYVSVDAAIDSFQALSQAQVRLDELEMRLLSKRDGLSSLAVEQPLSLNEEDLVYHTSRDQYCAQVETVRRYIVAGDVMQVVPSQRMSAPYQHDPLQLYRALRYLNPSPYLFYLNLETFHVVGSSPEILVRSEPLEDAFIEADVAADKPYTKKVTVRPIAGTRPRGRTDAEDQQFETDLLQDPKEIAEHVMLMDLGRNDLGRIAKTGSVVVTQDRAVERYSHVMHIVSNVEAKLKEGLNPFDVLRATFPAGTLSGAPKVRAMEIISELESDKRGIYGGAVGYIGFDQSIDLAIAIRTAVVKDGRLYVQAGAGVVADSQPASEWQETINKAQAVLKAMALSVSVK